MPSCRRSLSSRRAAAFAACALTIVLSSDSPRLDAQNGGGAWAIVGAQIADGTGAPLRAGTVRFAGGRIVSVGEGGPQPADTIVDAKGLIVSPGFIDIHNHSEIPLANDPAAETQVPQGITTAVLGSKTIGETCSATGIPTAVLGPDASPPWPIGDFLRRPGLLDAASSFTV